MRNKSVPTLHWCESFAVPTVDIGPEEERVEIEDVPSMTGGLF